MPKILKLYEGTYFGSQELLSGWLRKDSGQIDLHKATPKKQYRLE